MRNRNADLIGTLCKSIIWTISTRVANLKPISPSSCGPAGITIAREFLNSPYRVLLIESGLVDEHEPHMALNQVESEGEPAGDAAINFRRIFHGPNMGSFNQQAQPYGTRVRAFGGSAKYWGGRSATFDQMDFAKRD